MTSLVLGGEKLDTTQWDSMGEKKGVARPDLLVLRTRVCVWLYHCSCRDLFIGWTLEVLLNPSVGKDEKD